MKKSELSPDIQKFLCEHILSYEQLELLLIMRAEQGVSWTQDLLCARLSLTASLVGAALEGLESERLIQARAGASGKEYRYVRQNDDIEATIGRLGAAYRENPLPIVKSMSASAIERLRTAALRTFADAFILRKDKDRG